MVPPPPTVFFDACVLYPSALRSLLMYMALADLFRARWSNRVHEEWMAAVLKTRPDITRHQVERIRDLMNEHATDSLVSGFEHTMEQFTLPDPSDRHVLAAAVHCQACMIVTFNLKDFPLYIVRRYAIRPCSPDDLIKTLIHTSPDLVCNAVRRHRQSLKSPALSLPQYWRKLEACQIGDAVKALRVLSGDLGKP